jgi:hypothetical protein
MPNINSLLQKKAKVEPLNEGEAGRRSRDAQALQGDATDCVQAECVMNLAPMVGVWRTLPQTCRGRQLRKGRFARLDEVSPTHLPSIVHLYHGGCILTRLGRSHRCSRPLQKTLYPCHPLFQPKLLYGWYVPALLLQTRSATAVAWCVPVAWLLKMLDCELKHLIAVAWLDQ